ncbi:hypothetical protein Zmor_003566 [Zophobas morio]|uniref:DUF4817 domain-containing protein n=1 Tax=Zophobas morio TaxID=2755281 RepID=A0AA38HPE8_9CUCU|nr:hypothetical protein Zmor_003566 [Zophobas morio]
MSVILVAHNDNIIEIVENFNNEDYFRMIVLYGKCEESLNGTCRKFNELYPNRRKLYRTKLKQIIENLKNQGQFNVKTKRPANITEDYETVLNVLLAVIESKDISIREIRSTFEIAQSASF